MSNIPELGITVREGRAKQVAPVQEKKDMATPAETAIQAAGALMCKRMLNQVLNAAKQQITQVETNFTRDGVVLCLGGDAELSAFEAALTALIAKVAPVAPTK